MSSTASLVDFSANLIAYESINLPNFKFLLKFKCLDCLVALRVLVACN